MVAAAEQLLKLSWVALDFSQVDARAVGDAVAHASHTEGIRFGRWKTRQPFTEAFQHIIVIRETLWTPAMSTTWINVHRGGHVIRTQGDIIRDTVGQHRDCGVVVSHEQNGGRGEMLRHVLLIGKGVHHFHAVHLIAEEVF